MRVFFQLGLTFPKGYQHGSSWHKSSQHIHYYISGKTARRYKSESLHVSERIRIVNAKLELVFVTERDQKYSKIQDKVGILLTLLKL